MDTARQILAVGCVLMLLAGAVWALRRGRIALPRTRASGLQIVGRVTLTPQHSLHIVRSGEREWVLATHPQGCVTISERTPPGAPI